MSPVPPLPILLWVSTIRHDLFFRSESSHLSPFRDPVPGVLPGTYFMSILAISPFRDLVSGILLGPSYVVILALSWDLVPGISPGPSSIIILDPSSFGVFSCSGHTGPVGRYPRTCATSCHLSAPRPWLSRPSNPFSYFPLFPAYILPK